MDETVRNQDEIEIDLKRLMGTLLVRSWLIGLVAVVCAVAMFLGTYFFIAPKYQSSAMFYVNNSSLSLGDASLSISSGDISASRGLVKSYIVILKTRETLNMVADYAGVDISYGALKAMISAEAVDSTEIFRVTVTSEDPQQAEKLANAIAYILPKRIGNIIEGSSAKVVDSAVLPGAASSPSYTKNTMLGFLVGFVLSAGVVVLLELLDITIRSEEDIARSCKHPVLAAVPNLEQSGKGSYYGYGHKKKKYYTPPTVTKNVDPKVLVGASVSFSGAEAYKLLRTKLQFSFADEKQCHVIGIASALSGEGKSLTAANLAYMTAQLGKRVLLIDCDMRRPTQHTRLPVKKAPGLSEFLASLNTAENLIQPCGLKGEEGAFHVIAAGRIPPNPMELLSSLRMEKMIAKLREDYDYILLDLPPVGEVGDALAASKLTDGMLLVVRQDLCDKVSLNTAARQLAFVDAKILGIVFNCTVDGGFVYRHYNRRYYKKHYKKYGYKGYGQQTTKG